MKRDFPKITINHADDRPVGAHVITCGDCGAKDYIVANNAQGVVPSHMLNKKFTQRGWVIGKREVDDRCPQCKTASRTTKTEETKQETIMQNNVVAIKAEPPREMSRTDRRVIYAKLEDVYVDESVGYDTGWNDARVAKDLGVPVAWVKEIRDENFGAEGVNNEALEAFKALQAELHAERDSIADMAAKAQDAISQLGAKTNKLAEIQRRVDQVAKQLGIAK